jgi:hypothetical protein
MISNRKGYGNDGQCNYCLEAQSASAIVDVSRDALAITAATEVTFTAGGPYAERWCFALTRGAAVARIQTVDSAKIIGTSDFCVEIWTKCEIVVPGADGGPCSPSVSVIAGGSIVAKFDYAYKNTVAYANSLTLSTQTGALGAITTVGANGVPDATWRHLLICRHEGVCFGYIDGAQVGTVANAGNYAAAWNAGCFVFTNTPNVTLSVDQMRVSVGNSRWHGQAAISRPNRYNGGYTGA